MGYSIKKAAVLGAGVMGSQIAAHLANAGIPCVLLDIVLPELSDEDKKKGLTKESAAFRNKLANNAIKQLAKMKPSPVFSKKALNLLTPGNFEDDMEKIKDADWIIEVVAERMDIKKSLLSKVAEFAKPDAIISTNTSGLSVNEMVKDFPEDFQKRFLGTHFFNPPRYMKLLEIIPGEKTSKQIIDFMAKFIENKLGKGIVYCKDTVNFIGNRIGVFGMANTIQEMVRAGLTVSEVDAATGPVLGRPKTASFRTADLVGIDIMYHVSMNVYNLAENDEKKDEFKLPEFVEKMLENKWLGNKTRQGFYKKVKTDQGKQILELNYNTLEYEPVKKVKSASLEAAKQAGGVKKRIKTFVYGKDKLAQFAWKNISSILIYAANRLPEIADDIVNIDNALKWGFNWQLGPFEIWDAIGVKESVEKMKSEGLEIPEKIEKFLASGNETFYKEEKGVKYYYCFQDGTYKPVPVNKKFISLQNIKKDEQKIIKSNSGASLVDIGDGILCLEFHSKMNAIGADIVNMINQAVDLVEKDYEGLIIANEGKAFSVGANLMLVLLEAEDEEWEELDYMVKAFQKACMNIKYCSKPVVSAPFGYTFGGGLEVCLATDVINAYAETYTGLVEVGVGVIPAGGGTKELILRNLDLVPDNAQGVDILPFARRAFETIAMAKVATSAVEAKEFGYFKNCDTMTMNKDFLIHDAKKICLTLAETGFQPKRYRNDIKVPGKTALSLFKVAIYTMKEAKQISEHDALIGEKLAYIVSGGDLDEGSVVDEWYLLDLEREAFLSLCGHPKTQARMRHMLRYNKPLRN
jgi:3-hydroxyacyl-CoA dehydrogenase